MSTFLPLRAQAVLVSALVSKMVLYGSLPLPDSMPRITTLHPWNCIKAFWNHECGQATLSSHAACDVGRSTSKSPK